MSNLLASDQVPVTGRLQKATDFFRCFPARHRVGLGMGQVFIDFMEWEISSGRLSDSMGSPWWMAVNWMMIVDLSNTMRQSPEAEKFRYTIGQDNIRNSPWDIYLQSDVANEKELFWRAHQNSLSRAVELASPLLESEVVSEQRFIQLSLEIVDFVASSKDLGDAATLKQSLDKFYPSSYPITLDDLESLECSLILLAGEENTNQAILR